jgi:hypothetical protein
MIIFAYHHGRYVFIYLTDVNGITGGFESYLPMDTEHPRLERHSPAQDATVAGSFTASGTAPDDHGVAKAELWVNGKHLGAGFVKNVATGRTNGTVKVSVKAADASGIARVELLVNGKVVAKDTKAGYVLSVNTKKQKKAMKVQVRAYDKLGNVTHTSSRTWYRG